MKRILRIETNFKGAPAVLELAPCTKIIGSGKSGKTRFRDAFMVAMTGKHPGRSHPSQLFEALAPPGAEHIYANVIAEDGAAARFIAGPKIEGKVQRSVEGWFRDLKESDIQRAFPAESAGEIFAYGKDRSRRVVMSRWGVLAKGIRQPEMDEEDLPFWKEAIEATQAQLAADQGAEEQLLLLTKWFAAEAKRAKKEYDAANAGENAEVEDAAGAEMIPQLEANLVAARAWQKHQPLTDQLNRLRGEVAACTAALETARAVLMHVEADTDQVLAEPFVAPPASQSTMSPAQAQAIIAQAEHRIGVSMNLLALVKELHGQGSKTCPLCDQPTDLGAIAGRGSAKIAGRQADLVKLREKLREETSAITSARAEYEAVRGRAQMALQQARAKVANLEGQQAALARSVAQAEAALAGVGDKPYRGPPLEVVEKQLDTIRASVAAADKAKAQRLAARRWKKREDLAKWCLSKTQDMLVRSIRSAIGSAEAEINAFAPEQVQVRLDPDDYNWTALGIDGRAHDRHLMCGTERAATVLALAAAWSMPLGILWIDDDDLRGIDPEVRYSHLMRLESLVKEGRLAQVVVLSCWPQHLPDWPQYDADASAAALGAEVPTAGAA